MAAGPWRELEILSAIAQGRPLTQRALAQRVGMALGLADLYVKRLVRQGYVKVTTVPPNRIRYQFLNAITLVEIRC